MLPGHLLAWTSRFSSMVSSPSPTVLLFLGSVICSQLYSENKRLVENSRSKQLMSPIEHCSLQVMKSWAFLLPPAQMWITLGCRCCNNIISNSSPQDIHRTFLWLHSLPSPSCHRKLVEQWGSLHPSLPVWTSPRPLFSFFIFHLLSTTPVEFLSHYICARSGINSFVLFC